MKFKKSKMQEEMKNKFIFIIFLILTSFLAYWSFFYEPSLLKVRHEKFSWKLEPLKVAFFADLHAGAPFIDLKYIDHLVQVLNEENLDLVLIGGDLVINGVVGGHAVPFEEVANRLSRIKSKYGTFAVLGNHDWWNDGESIRDLLKKYGIHVLENEFIVLSFEKQSTINLIGIGDDMTGHADTEKVFSKIKNNFPKIALLHDPGALLDLPGNQSFDLVLAGHMHCGQVNLPFIGPLITPGRAPKEWARGWSDTAFGRLFVTRGIGTSILPIRLNAPPEVVILDFFNF